MGGGSAAKGIWLVLPLALLVAALLGAACGEEGDEVAARRIKVVVSLPLFADFVQEIGGERVEVFSLLPPGSDPHTFEPTPQDVQRLSQADLILYNGLGLEQPLLDVIFENARRGAQIIAYARALPSPTAEQPPPTEYPVTAEAAGDNPHLWLDLQMAKLYVQSTEDSLEIVDGPGAPIYRENAAAYLEELDALHQEISANIQSIPAERRKLVTTHDAFPHFARYLGLELVAFVTPGPGHEPSPRDVADLVQAIEEEGLPAVFAEPQVEAQGRILRQAAEDAGVRVCTLYSDSLDKRVRTYIEMMRFNVDELVRCLGGGEGD